MTNGKRQNLAHVARVRGQIRDAATRLGAPLQEEMDDLDVFDFADVPLGQSFAFRIFKYRGIGEDVVDIMFESQRQDWRERLQEVLDLMGVGPNDVLWTNERYLDTP